MAKAFAEWPEALAATIEIAERCDVELELGRQLIPRYPTPGDQSELGTSVSWLQTGLRPRYGDPVPGEAQSAADYELGVIERMGFAGYFLIVWDFVKYAKDAGIAVRSGPRLGRGLAGRLLAADHRRRSAAVRAAVRAIPEPRARVDADIDIDFSVRGRERVIRLRDREIRQGLRCADRDVSQAVPARRHARRGACARPRLPAPATGSRS